MLKNASTFQPALFVLAAPGVIIMGSVYSAATGAGMEPSNFGLLDG